MARVLVVDDDRTQRALLRRFLRNDGHEIEAAEDGVAALAVVQSTPVDVVVTDMRMPGMNGRELLRRLQELDPSLPVIVMTAFADLQDAVDLVTREGAAYYIQKPIEDMKVLREEIRRAVGDAADDGDAADAPPSVAGSSGDLFADIVGGSAPMQKLLREMQRLTPILAGPATVLVTGESGTGKELIATALHRCGPRSDKPFVAVNCAAIPDELIEAELFGAEKGSYTSSTQTRAGYFEEAEGGTVFLDEIAEVNATMQVKLLRVLANREYARIGTSKQRTANVCVVAATNRTLEDEVRQGRFREDLFYRLNVFRVHAPPLRDRREDVADLSAYLLARFTSEFGLPAKYLTDEALATLRRFAWPGNVRQLDHYLQQTVVMSDSDTIGVEDLPAETDEPSAEPSFLSEVLERELSLEDVERQLILAALERADGVQTAASKLLGVSRRKLQYRMEKHKIPSDAFRDGGDGPQEDDEE
ncbi:sigma-54-dependent Fis family transcriptional regulator [Candidatus Poribacteria bacterium]|jgi:DNA-binding NtrC family response regulator|nr:sigma-54-dependent Fis family transcriptional regulator [Candidatus Poribacteria bacterium]MBT5536916.1 sigma-54-dependent Fis family transcriptional regulator [Candidatus Poribacteria bacterium]MBT5714868.1 sigma-54-dependent Fis family transcriptional regulator [Candidatus Poribacteria bacterium]MBT7097715.1 sigma-54-dependent Fis family transcriptional regulator [Candidatus Poribacteria bacterium]